MYMRIRTTLSKALLFLVCLLFLSSCIENEIPELVIAKDSFELTGEEQTIYLDIQSGEDWEIRSYCDWITISSTHGTGAKRVEVRISESLFSERSSALNVLSSNGDIRISVHQMPVFSLIEKKEFLRRVYLYRDIVELYYKKTQVVINGGIQSKKYFDMISELEWIENNNNYPVSSYSDGFDRIRVTGVELYVNSQFVSDVEINFNELFVEDSSFVRGKDYYLGMGRDGLIDFFRNSKINENSYFATWPSFYDSVRLTLQFNDTTSLVRFIITGEPSYWSDEYNKPMYPHFVDIPIPFSLLSYSAPTPFPSIMSNEYCLLYDRLDGMCFYDQEGNQYEFSIKSQMIEDFANIDMYIINNSDFITSTYSSEKWKTNTTYPMIRITKNKELWYEFIGTMYEEYLDEDIQTSKEICMIGCDGWIPIDGKGYQFLLQVDYDEPNNPIIWFELFTHTDFSESNHGFTNYSKDIFPMVGCYKDGKESVLKVFP